MSGTELPDGALARARQELSRRGYLAGSLPVRPLSPLALAARLVLFALALAAVLALAEVGFGGQPTILALPVAAGFLPAALLSVCGGYWLCRWLAWVLLRLGGEPGAAATAGAVLVGAAIVSLLAAMGRPAAVGVATVPGLAGGLALALAGMLWMRHHLVLLLSYPAPAAAGRVFGGTALVVVVAGGVLSVLVLAQRRGEEAGEAAASFPLPHGRLAVVAVDGLAREDLEAAAELVAGAGLHEAAVWGWAAMAPPRPALPVVFWTTVACGVPPALHGITVLEEVRLFGLDRGVPLSPLGRAAVAVPLEAVGLARTVARPATIRHRPTFWEMASRAGVPVTVGGWWGSWPVRRVVGEVASERAWLGGDGGEDAVTAGLAASVATAWSGASEPATATDHLALELVQRAAHAPSPHLLVLAVPALDIARRAHLEATPLELVRWQLPHLEVLEAVLTGLAEADYAVWLIGAPWHGGTGFVAVSTAPAGRHEPCAAETIAATVLDALGLPAPVNVPAPRRDLSGVQGPLAGPVNYGPPPPPLAAPSTTGQQGQLEVLRNLGYLQ